MNFALQKCLAEFVADPASPVVYPQLVKLLARHIDQPEELVGRGVRDERTQRAVSLLTQSPDWRAGIIRRLAPWNTRDLDGVPIVVHWGFQPPRYFAGDIGIHTWLCCHVKTISPEAVERLSQTTGVVFPASIMVGSQWLLGTHKAGDLPQDYIDKIAEHCRYGQSKAGAV